MDYSTLLRTKSRIFVSVVDDEEDLVYLFKDALSQLEGIEIFAFTDPLLALEHFKVNHENYSIIISDYRMPAMNGIELLRGVKSINPSVIRILISAFDVHENEFRECDCINKFFQKPIKMGDFINEVGTIVKSVLIRNIST